MKLYRLVGLTLAVVFAATGLVFLFIPEQVLVLFNNLSPGVGLPQSPLSGLSIYLILAAGYMYLVTLLALMMYMRPQSSHFAWLLVHAKMASSLLSLAFFVVHAHYLVYLANFIIDGIIGAGVLLLYVRRVRFAG